MKDVTIGKSLKLKSTILSMTADLHIYLPQGYEESKESYPVMYTFRHFHIASGILSVHVPQMILVDFSNFNYSLFSLYEKKDEPGSAKADEVLQFLKKELVPYIDSIFRTKPTRILYGASSGGIFAIYALFSEPSLFDAVFAAGPMFSEFEEDRVFNILVTALRKREPRNNSLFFTAGDQPDIVPHIESFKIMLETHQPEGLKWKYNQASGENHMSLVSKTLHEGLQWYLSEYCIIPDHVIIGGKDAFKKHLDGLLQKFGGNEISSSQIFNMTISRHRMEKNFEKALSAAKLYVEFMPDMPLSYFYLAETYADMGQKKLARENYEAAIAQARKTRPGLVDFLETKIKKLEGK
ncbi:MAG: alpha/beta hydrolase-fold protein [Candidatus Aminicenantes bacterium]|nr:alpha/beta hydrolase-fold protein [Candidatus Aminicenantes bacterium]